MHKNYEIRINFVVLKFGINKVTQHCVSSSSLGTTLWQRARRIIFFMKKERIMERKKKKKEEKKKNVKE